MTKFSLLKVLDAEAMEDGAWLHFTDPRTGEPMYKGGDETLPMRAKVRHSESKLHESIQAEFMRRRPQILARTKLKERDEVDAKLLHAHAIKRFHASLIALENCSEEQAGLVSVDEETAKAIYEDPEVKWMTLAVVVFSGSEGNYGRPTQPPGDDEKPAGKPPRPPRPTSKA